MAEDMNTLERRIAADRNLLAGSIDALAQALSPERLSRTVSREVQARSGALGETAMNAARANPVGALLLGAGLAALLAGPKRPVKTPLQGGDHDAGLRPENVALSGADVLTGEFDARVRAADDAIKAGPRAPRMRAALNRGLANLPAPARARVIAAREAAIEAQEKLDRKAALAARKARGFHHRQPLSTGALALALGAIAAALLPRTRVENDMLGAHRDSLLQKAELILRDEIAAATATGEAALREGLQAGADRLRHH